MNACRSVCAVLTVLLLAGCQTSRFADLVTRPGDPLFKDDFSDPSSGWIRTKNPAKTGVMDYDQGTFRMLVLERNYDLWSVPGLDFQDARIEVGARRLGGPLENRFGIICRFRSSQDYYFFVVSSDGYYAIGKVSQGVTSLLGQAMMAYSQAIVLGDGQNHLRFDCIGRMLTGFVNGQAVAMVADADYSEGDVGLLVGTFDAPGADVAFDHFIVIKP